MKLRAATAKDLPQILEIFNEVVRNSTATFVEAERPLEELENTFKLKSAQGLPTVVIEIDDRVVAYGTFGAFRNASGYHSTVEHSLHVSPEFRGQGLGTMLLQNLIDHARGQGFHAMIAAVDSANQRSISLHTKFGFKVVGQIPEVAQKFSRWLDLTLLQLLLT